MDTRRIAAILGRIYSAVLIILTISMFVTVSYNVFMRFVMNRSVGWADELSRFLFIWASFIGAVIAFKNNEHVGLSFVVDKIQSAAIRRAIAAVRQLLVLLVLALLTWYGYRASTTVMNVSPALSIPMSIIYLIVPFTGLMMLIIGIAKFIVLLQTGEIPEEARTSVE